MAESPDTLAERERCLTIVGRALLGNGRTSNAVADVPRALRAIRDGVPAEQFEVAGDHAK
jgi:hypothetical protein